MFAVNDTAKLVDVRVVNSSSDVVYIGHEFGCQRIPGNKVSSKSLLTCHALSTATLHFLEPLHGEVHLDSCPCGPSAERERSSAAESPNRQRVKTVSISRLRVKNCRAKISSSSLGFKVLCPIAETNSASLCG